MIGIFSDVPSYCPKCGERFEYTGVLAEYIGREIINGVAQRCDCGFQYAVISTEYMLDATDRAGSDLSEQSD